MFSIIYQLTDSRLKHESMNIAKIHLLLTNKRVCGTLQNCIPNSLTFFYSGKIKLSDAVIVSENLPKVYAMKTQMIQLLQNLISNAMKYQKPNIPPYIEVKAEEKETEWEFSVKDNGIGIDEKFFDKIFVIFQRLHSKTQFSGTGIGLAICKKIIEKHKGRIWVVSVPQEGTTFYFTIPKK